MYLIPRFECHFPRPYHAPVFGLTESSAGRSLFNLSSACVSRGRCSLNTKAFALYGGEWGERLDPPGIGREITFTYIRPTSALSAAGRSLTLLSAISQMHESLLYLQMQPQLIIYFFCQYRLSIGAKGLGNSALPGSVWVSQSHLTRHHCCISLLLPRWSFASTVQVLTLV
jgi:hypothetical protein